MKPAIRIVLVIMSPAQVHRFVVAMQDPHSASESWAVLRAIQDLCFGDPS